LEAPRGFEPTIESTISAYHYPRHHDKHGASRANVIASIYVEAINK